MKRRRRNQENASESGRFLVVIPIVVMSVSEYKRAAGKFSKESSP